LLSSLPKFVWIVTVITVAVSPFSTRADYRSEDVSVKSASKASRRRRRKKKRIAVLLNTKWPKCRSSLSFYYLYISNNRCEQVVTVDLTTLQ
jgi:hypothetical protein